MLGTPNGGSWAPMQVLSGDDTFGNTLAAVGSLFDAEKSRGIMAQMPGFLQLQAGLLDPQRNLGTAQGWQDLATRDKELVKQASIWHSLPLQMQACTWGLPPDDVLKAAIALRKQFDAQRADLAKLACDKLVLVVGQAKFTPDGYEETPEDGLVYLNAVDVGDGRVTLDSAMLPNVPTWTTPTRSRQPAESGGSVRSVSRPVAHGFDHAPRFRFGNRRGPWRGHAAEAGRRQLRALPAVPLLDERAPGEQRSGDDGVVPARRTRRRHRPQGRDQGAQRQCAFRRRSADARPLRPGGAHRRRDRDEQAARRAALEGAQRRALSGGGRHAADLHQRLRESAQPVSDVAAVGGDRRGTRRRGQARRGGHDPHRAAGRDRVVPARGGAAAR